jgi:hypothetical protein
MKIVNHNKGRLGNSIFRLLANVVFLIVYDIDGEIIYNNFNCTKTISDEYFCKWADNILNGKIDDTIDKNSIILFDGYYQHDKIYSFFRPQIIDYLKKRPNLLLLTHFTDNYKVGDLFHTSNKQYDIVVHIRLEDFIQINQVLNPLTICQILDENVNNNKNICLVLNKPTEEIEFKYIDYLKNKYNIIVESNDPITDFHIMKNAEMLICSYSTLSWCAAFFSDSVKKVYIPNYNISLHQTFNALQHTKVTLYDCDFCNIERLSSILQKSKVIY